MVARDPSTPGDSPGSIDLSRMALAISKRERVDGKAFTSRDRKHSRRVEPSTEEDQGWGRWFGLNRGGCGIHGIGHSLETYTATGVRERRREPGHPPPSFPGRVSNNPRPPQAATVVGEGLRSHVPTQADSHQERRERIENAAPRPRIGA